MGMVVLHTQCLVDKQILYMISVPFPHQGTKQVTGKEGHSASLSNRARARSPAEWRAQAWEGRAREVRASQRVLCAEATLGWQSAGLSRWAHFPICSVSSIITLLGLPYQHKSDLGALKLKLPTAFMPFRTNANISNMISSSGYHHHCSLTSCPFVCSFC